MRYVQFIEAIITQLNIIRILACNAVSKCKLQLYISQYSTGIAVRMCKFRKTHTSYSNDQIIKLLLLRLRREIRVGFPFPCHRLDLLGHLFSKLSEDLRPDK